jgi:hypothetical protein
MPLLPAEPLNCTKQIPLSLEVDETGKPDTRVQVSPLSMLCHKPSERVPQNSTSSLLGSTTSLSPFWRPMQLPWNLNMEVTFTRVNVSP